MKYPFATDEVREKFSQYPDRIRKKLLELRELIFNEAHNTKNVGALTESLKWGQPSYLTSETKSGTTVRIDQYKQESNKIALFVNCQTSLIEDFREVYEDAFAYEKNRAILLPVEKKLPATKLSHFINMAHTYHLRKKQSQQT